MDDDEFGSVAENNLEMINEEEKKYEIENQFMQHDAMTDKEFAEKVDSDLEKVLDETVTSEITSKSQLFASNSSKLGSIDSSNIERPNLGFGNIKRYFYHIKTKWA